MPTFDLVVGNNYQVSNGQQSASFAFLGMIGFGNRRALLFDNPNLIGGLNFRYLAATPEIIYPEQPTTTVTVEVRLRLRLVGADQNGLVPYTGPNQSWTIIGGSGDKG